MAWFSMLFIFLIVPKNTNAILGLPLSTECDSNAINACNARVDSAIQKYESFLRNGSLDPSTITSPPLKNCQIVYPNLFVQRTADYCRTESILLGWCYTSSVQFNITFTLICDLDLKTLETSQIISDLLNVISQPSCALNPYQDPELNNLDVTGLTACVNLSVVEGILDDGKVIIFQQNLALNVTFDYSNTKDAKLVKVEASSALNATVTCDGPGNFNEMCGCVIHHPIMLKVRRMLVRIFLPCEIAKKFPNPNDWACTDN